MGLGGGVSFHVLGKLCEFYSCYCPKQKGIATKHQQLGKLFYIQNLKWEADIKKVFKNFSCFIEWCSLFSVLSGPLYVEKDTFCRTWDMVCLFLVIPQTGVRRRRNNPYFEKSIDINIPCSSHLKGAFQWI